MRVIHMKSRMWVAITFWSHLDSMPASVDKRELQKPSVISIRTTYFCMKFKKIH